MIPSKMLLPAAYSMAAGTYYLPSSVEFTDKLVLLYQEMVADHASVANFDRGIAKIEINHPEILQGSSGTECSVIIASCQGNFILSLCSLARYAKIATVYWEISEFQGDLLHRSGVKLIDGNLSTSGVIGKIYEAVDAGYKVVVLGDGPASSLSGRRQSFLGYSVRCSGLASFLSRSFPECAVFMQFQRLTDRQFRVEIDHICGNNLTVQAILLRIESKIISNWITYKWSGGSIILSSLLARANGIINLSEIIDWRDRLANKSFSAGP